MTTLPMTTANGTTEGDEAVRIAQGGANTQASGTHMPEPWRACREGECKCGQIWSKTADQPVATVISGEWGDEYPALRLVGETSLQMKAEAYTERMTYGSIDPEIAKANVRRIVACVNACAGIPTADLKSIRTFALDVVRERDELAAAIRSYREAVQDHDQWTSPGKREVNRVTRARAAMFKVLAKAPP